MENIDTRATAFGRVVGAIMEARGIPAEPEAIRELGERSGFDGERLLDATTRDTAANSLRPRHVRGPWTAFA